MYTVNTSNNTKNLYLCCKYRAQHKCYARVIVKDGNLNNACLKKKHEHLAFKTELCKSKVDKIMKKICNENNHWTAREAYCKARESLHENDVNYIPARKSYGTFVHRMKKKFEPKIPHSFEEFDEFINDEKYKKKYSFDSRNNTFYRGSWKTKNGDSMIVFISETGQKFLEEQTNIELMMDGTFKLLPRLIKFAQFFIMSFILENRSYPFAFIFMEKRDAESYDLLFTKMKSLFIDDITTKVSKCMADYEKAVRKALKNHFPAARISGCWFHYVKSINKAARKYGLSKDTKFQKVIQEVCCIALLPNNFISDGFDYVDTQVTNSARWSRFSSYWKRQWRNANISVFALRHRTDNFSESLNKSFNLLSGRPHQDIWSVIRTIKKIETEKMDELLQHKDGKMFKTKRENSTTELNTKILEATRKFEETQDVGLFLRNVSYRGEAIITIAEDEGENCDEGFFDDVVPNYFDESYNFARNDADHRYADCFKRNDTILKRHATNHNDEEGTSKKINKLICMDI